MRCLRWHRSCVDLITNCFFCLGVCPGNQRWKFSRTQLLHGHRSLFIHRQRNSLKRGFIGLRLLRQAPGWTDKAGPQHSGKMTIPMLSQTALAEYAVLFVHSVKRSWSMCSCSPSTLSRPSSHSVYCTSLSWWSSARRELVGLDRMWRSYAEIPTRAIPIQWTNVVYVGKIRRANSFKEL